MKWIILFKEKSAKTVLLSVVSHVFKVDWDLLIVQCMASLKFSKAALTRNQTEGGKKNDRCCKSRCSWSLRVLFLAVSPLSDGSTTECHRVSLSRAAEGKTTHPFKRLKGAQKTKNKTKKHSPEVYLCKKKQKMRPQTTPVSSTSKDCHRIIISPPLIKPHTWKSFWHTLSPAVPASE